MLHRDDPSGFTVITQPAHAFVSGQLARAWGGRRFGSFEPYEEVCLAAEQHDIGWLEWERSPTLNAKTGKPYSFMELPIPDHTSMWANAGELAKIQNRYSALLVSMHGSGLYERHDNSKDSSRDTALIKAYLKDAHAFENALIDELKGDSRYAAHVAQEVFVRNRRLVGVWDYLSLMVCIGLKKRQSRTIDHVPAAKGEVALTIESLSDDLRSYSMSPWPFKMKSVSLHVEGRRLPGTFSDDASMRAALEAAEWVSLELSIGPG